MEDGAPRRLTVVSGPPGSGKTSAISRWSDLRYPDSTVWWSVETAGVRNGLGALPLAHLSEHNWSRNSLLVIDGVDLITDPSIAAGIVRLLNDLPTVQVVLVGRQWGNLHLAAFGLNTDLHLIGEADLAFTITEVEELLAATAFGPGVAAAADLLDQTEGWAAGLRLECMNSRENPEGSFSDAASPGGAVWEYFERGVLAAMTPAEVDVLTRTSILRTVTPEMAEAVSGYSDAGHLLESLRSRNLFVRPSPTGDGYVYHRMLSQHLRQRLSLEGRSVQRSVHVHAAEWFAAAGDGGAASRYYARAGEYDLAIESAAAAVVHSLLVGGPNGYQSPLPGDVPDWYLARDPHRMYLCGAALLSASRPDDADTWISRLRTRLQVGAAPRDLARLEILSAMRDSQSMDPEGVLRHYERGQAGLGEGSGIEEFGADRSTPQWLASLDAVVLAALPWMVARAYADIGEPEPALALLEERQSLGGIQPGPGAAATAHTSVALAAGRLREVLALTDELLRGGDGGPRPPAVLVDAYLARAAALIERDELPAAHDAIRSAATLSAQARLHPWSVATQIESARLRLAEGSPRSALRELTALGSAGGAGAPGRSATVKAAALELRCQLALGDVDAARRLLDQVPAGARQPACLARIELAAGRPDRAAMHLSRAAELAVTPRQKLEALLLRARIELQVGKLTMADDLLQRALQLARPEGFRRIFLEEPPHVLDALRGINRFAPDAFLTEILHRASSEHSEGQAASPPRMIEPLTPRERELVGYLPSHYSQAEIARTLYISSNTVKTHMKGLYRKLGATSRSEAVHMAKLYGLLSVTPAANDGPGWRADDSTERWR